jgi:hypothetical protein
MKKNDPPYSTWWERDFFCMRSMVSDDVAESGKTLANMAAGVVVILLQDRHVNKIDVAPKARPKLNLKFLQQRPQAPDDEIVNEIQLTIPGRVYKGTGKHGEGHKRMHYRAEHVRRQPYGPRSTPQYREIVIPGMWINADDVPPEERGTPVRNYRFTGVRPKSV